VIRSTVADIDLEALADNFRAIGGYLTLQAAPAAESRTPETAAPASGQGWGAGRIIAVVKANAYGHGATAVGPALERAGATTLACADIEEAIALREAGATGRILVFGALSLSDLDGVFDFGLTPSISTPTAGREVQRAAARRGVRVAYHLKIDTGMNRLGFRHDNLRRTIPELLAAPNLALAGVYTHFATADEPDDPLFGRQRDAFARARQDLAAIGAPPHLVHAANSAAVLADPAVWFDRVRPGLLLYGVVPGPLRAPIALRPVMSLRSRVVAVKGVRAGESIGYGARFRASRPTSMAVVPAGYADGLDTRMAGRCDVLIRGHRAPIVGSVCMDMVTVDVTGLVVAPGDEVVVVGRQGDAEITVAEQAARIGTIPYELLCRVGTRIERIYNRARP
jgi:alanine racemase